MKKTIPNNSGDNLQKKIKSYSALAGAFVALTPVAHAGVVYTEIDPDTTLFSGEVLQIDMDGDQIVDFSLAPTIITYAYGTGSVVFNINYALAFVRPGNAIAGSTSTFTTSGGSTLTFQIPYALNPGISVGSSMSFNSNTEPHTLGAFISGYYTLVGNFNNVTDKFLGVRFLINGNTHYGWIRLDVQMSGAGAPNISVKGYAYEDVPNTPIATSLAVTLPSEPVSNIQVADVADNGNGQDLQVSFNKAVNESKVGEYRIIAVKSTGAAGFDLTAANSVTAGNYTSVTPNGNNISQVLSAGAKDKDGDLIANQVAYKVFVLSVADGINATINALSSASAEITLTALSCQEHNITINAGWNMISTYINPDSADMLAVLNAIASDILLAKNGQGQAVIPSLGINAIGNWNVLEGYKIKTSNATTLVIGCQQVNPLTTPIALSPGWSIIAYLRTTPMDIVATLSNIDSNILLVKDNGGNTYLPSFGINTIGDMIPGQGYKIKMSASDILTYPANDTTAKTFLSGNYLHPVAPSFFSNYNRNTGHNGTIVIPEGSLEGLYINDEIGIFNRENMLAGSGVYNGRNLAITIWGDDPTTPDIEGFNTGDKLVYKIWQAGSNEVILAQVDYASGNNFYETDGISILKKLEVKAEKLGNAANVTVYPNPFKDEVSLKFSGLQEADIEIDILDIYGKKVKETRVRINEGMNTIGLNMTELIPGVYFMVFQSNNYLHTIKVEKY